jgi:hypothetical protein
MPGRAAVDVGDVPAARVHRGGRASLAPSRRRARSSGGFPARRSGGRPAGPRRGACRCRRGPRGRPHAGPRRRRPRPASRRRAGRRGAGATGGPKGSEAGNSCARRTRPCAGRCRHRRCRRSDPGRRSRAIAGTGPARQTASRSRCRRQRQRSPRGRASGPSSRGDPIRSAIQPGRQDIVRRRGQNLAPHPAVSALDPDLRTPPGAVCWRCQRRRVPSGRQLGAGAEGAGCAGQAACAAPVAGPAARDQAPGVTSPAS